VGILAKSSLLARLIINKHHQIVRVKPKVRKEIIGLVHTCNLSFVCVCNMYVCMWNESKTYLGRVYSLRGKKDILCQLLGCCSLVVY
ncbi:unnamed protein product, partial [Brassica napus]